MKVNDTELTRESTPRLGELLAGEAGTKVDSRCDTPASEKPEVIELTRERFVNDPATGELLQPLLRTVTERLAKEPRDVGLLELRAELAGQWSDWKAQAADYTAVIEGPAEQPAEAVSAPLRRLYRRRGDAYVNLQKWPEAVDDYAHVITPETTDALLLSNRARAHEALKHWDSAAADWSRAAAEDPEGAIWLAEFAGRLVARGQLALVKPQLERARALYERSLAVAPDGTPVDAKPAHALDRKLARAYESAGLGARGGPASGEAARCQSV